MQYRSTDKVTRNMSITGFMRECRGSMVVVRTENIMLVPDGIVDTAYDVSSWVRDGYLRAIEKDLSAELTALPMIPLKDVLVPKVELESVAVIESEPTVMQTEKELELEVVSKTEIELDPAIKDEIESAKVTLESVQVPRRRANFRKDKGVNK